MTAQFANPAVTLMILIAQGLNSHAAPGNTRRVPEPGALPARPSVALLMPLGSGSQATGQEPQEALRSASTDVQRAAAHVAVGRAYLARGEQDKAEAEFK